VRASGSTGEGGGPADGREDGQGQHT
jgi:hypothetical protein